MRPFRHILLISLALVFILTSLASAATTHRHSGRHPHAGRAAHLTHKRHHRARRARRHAKPRHVTRHRAVATKAKQGTTTTKPVAGRTSAPVSSARMPQPVRVAAPVVSGQTFYVSGSGSDSNSGLSPSQAWRTVGRVNRQVLAPGDAVLFEGGQTFADADLEPATSGVSGRAVVFGSYGSGDAQITQGAWFVKDYLLFDHLQFASTLYGGSSTRGTSNHITVQNCQFTPPSGNQQLGVYANGSDWTLANNVIRNTGLSGMLLNGDGYRIVGNTIDNVGLYDAGYNAHGIYLDASDATITDNTITNFSESAVSARYHSSTIERNYMAGGQIGIDFYQTDATAGTSQWLNNTIKSATVAGIYVSSNGVYSLRESFVIHANAINTPGPMTNLRATTTGTYTTSDNSAF